MKPFNKLHFSVRQIQNSKLKTTLKRFILIDNSLSEIVFYLQLV